MYFVLQCEQENVDGKKINIKDVKAEVNKNKTKYHIVGTFPISRKRRTR
jgi:hypothetical protein